ncbi:TonB-dependent receptor [Polaribacter pacificus]|uniref:TonB-dependent receptor n=1 Tax=Polaribacter pacificus TaxID=1775173 RepID=A0A917MB89_9FLAO|nr:TonB-dependent receptor [Polaribacter pacificus]GGG89070.1 TonB-dependent receptor [Polaribacter pacificus]
MKRIVLLAIILFQFSLTAQTLITGVVKDSQGQPIYGANVYLKGAYDGTSTDEKGAFSFSSTEKGIQTLVVSFLSFEEYQKVGDVSTFTKLKITLREDVNTLDAVTINAGTFKSGDQAKVTALKPLDVVTTAGAMGDFVGALQTLPGTSNVSEDGRLFVRGGEAGETQMFIDGIRVFTPYAPSARNIPTRGRFSPFLFKGISFSTGGYSAEYGQALSSVLLLNSIDEPEQEKTDISLMTVGLGLGHTKKWKKSSFSVNSSYFNLAPYQSAFPDNNEWTKPVQSLSGEFIFRHRFKDEALLKIYGAYSGTQFDLIQEDINVSNGFRFGLKNRNLYFNTSYKNALANDWSILTGVSFNSDHSDIDIQNDFVTSAENSIHAKLKLKKRYSNRFKVSYGAEYFLTDFDEKFKDSQAFEYNSGFVSHSGAIFTESEVFFSKKLAATVGLRADYSKLSDELVVSPRVSLAYKSGANSQFSLAYGQFYQQAQKEYLKYNSQLKSENTNHLIANFQYVKNNQILRVEAFYKGYQDLVKYNTEFALPTSNFINNGDGYAKGVDVFWRDNKSINNVDYWISYSYLDTQRAYKNYPTTSTPSFASTHNMSAVAKYWVGSLKSQLGLSYNFSSGRTYTNPNEQGFLNAVTKNYHAVNANWAYLISQQKILYFSVSNVLGTQNVNGYQYANQQNNQGVYERRALVPSADRFFFVGFFWTLSADKKLNQLDNL